MAITVIIHIAGSDAITADIESMPDPMASFITCTNPRTRDGKPIVYIEPEATRVLFPWSRITFIETMPSEEDQEEIETFFRD
jgi:hypothetical protein